MNALRGAGFIMRCLLAGICATLLARVCPASAEGPDDLYRQGRYAEAERAYSEADMDHPRDPRYRFNRGCAAYQAANYEGALAAFSSVLSRAEAQRSGETAQDHELRFRAGYNLGCAAFKKGDYETAVSAFRKALVHRPEDPDARHNLELALRALQKQKNGASKKPEDASSKDRADQEQGRSEPSPSEGAKGEKKPGPEDSPANKEEKPREDRASDGSGEKADQRESQDLSGDLKTLQEGTDQAQEGRPVDRERQMMDRKRAEALLDNIREDPAKILRYQGAKERARGVPSGKDW